MTSFDHTAAAGTADTAGTACALQVGDPGAAARAHVPGAARAAPVAGPGSFLTLHYRLSGPAGDVVNTFGGKPATLSLGAGQLSAALEECLAGLPEGAHARFDLAPGAAFGARSAAMEQWVARSLLIELFGAQQQYQAGEVLCFPAPDGAPGSCAGAVLQVRASDGAVLCDFNHPLAGRPVAFEVQLIAVL